MVICRMFSRLIETARKDTPMTCFDRFMEFHQYIVRAMTDIMSVQTVDENIRSPNRPELTRKILKSSTSTKIFRGRTTQKFSLDPIKENDENMVSSPCHLNNTIELVKKIKAEASKWFIDFLEMFLESGFNKSKGTEDGEANVKVSQSLILKVINWIEVEYCDSASNKQHQRAEKICRKLRMKIKNNMLRVEFF